VLELIFNANNIHTAHAWPTTISKRKKRQINNKDTASNAELSRLFRLRLDCSFCSLSPIFPQSNLLRSPVTILLQFLIGYKPSYALFRTRVTMIGRHDQAGYWCLQMAYLLVGSSDNLHNSHEHISPRRAPRSMRPCLKNPILAWLGSRSIVAILAVCNS